MRCHICDAAIAEPQFNRDHEDWDPCVKCQGVIQDTLEGFNDQAIFVSSFDEPTSLAAILPPSILKRAPIENSA